MPNTLDQLISKHFSSASDLDEKTKAMLQDMQDLMDDPQSSTAVEAILDAMPFGITLIDMTKHILYANPTAIAMMGYANKEEVAGRLCHDTLCPAEKEKCPIIDLKLKVDRSDRILITKDRQKIPILKSVTPIQFKGQEVLLEAFVDNSEQKQIEQERQSLSDIRSEFARQTSAIIKTLAPIRTVSEVYRSLISLVRDRFGFDRVQFYLFNPVANNLQLTQISGLHDKMPIAQKAILPWNVGAVGRAAANGETQIAVSADLEISGHVDHIGPGIKTQAALPLLSGSELIGVLDIQNQTAEPIDSDAILFIEMLLVQVSLLLENIRTQVDLTEQFAEISSLQKKSSVEGWLEFNETSMAGRARYVYDRDLEDVFPVTDSDIHQAAGRSTVSPLEVRGTVIGTLGIQEDADTPLTDEEKLLIESISAEVAEALERARLFESSQRSASELAVLNEMGARFAQADSQDFINQTIYDYTCKLMQAPQFFIAYFDEAKQEIFFPFVMLNGERVTPEHPAYDQWAPRPLGTGLTGYIITQRIPILIDSNAEDTLEKLGLPYLQFGGSTHSWLGVPMVIGDRTLGVISVQSEEAMNLYSHHHMDLLTTIASQAAVSINNTRLFQQEQERAQQERMVRTITDRVRRGQDTQNILQIALEELSTALDADLSTIQLGVPENLLDNGRFQNEGPDPEVSRLTDLEQGREN
jgi:PAS domain S-box-containing protein